MGHLTLSGQWAVIPVWQILGNVRTVGRTYRKLLMDGSYGLWQADRVDHEGRTMRREARSQAQDGNYRREKVAKVAKRSQFPK